mmetsp:Transcript_17340/g.21633  ORF Transcript_17340/g.21633 Transcript_17340/m.21633 type:complete len:93 (+) Transcript_17340:380-658(+)
MFRMTRLVLGYRLAKTLFCAAVIAAAKARVNPEPVQSVSAHAPDVVNGNPFGSDYKDSSLEGQSDLYGGTTSVRLSGLGALFLLHRKLVFGC